MRPASPSAAPSVATEPRSCSARSRSRGARAGTVSVARQPKGEPVDERIEPRRRTRRLHDVPFVDRGHGRREGCCDADRVARRNDVRGDRRCPTQSSTKTNRSRGSCGSARAQSGSATRTFRAPARRARRRPMIARSPLGACHHGSFPGRRVKRQTPAIRAAALPSSDRADSRTAGRRNRHDVEPHSICGESSRRRSPRSRAREPEHFRQDMWTAGLSASQSKLRPRSSLLSKAASDARLRLRIRWPRRDGPRRQTSDGAETSLSRRRVVPRRGAIPYDVKNNYARIIRK